MRRVAVAGARSTRGFSSTEAPLVKTTLYDMHLEMGGKMVPFAGYELPVQVQLSSLRFVQIHWGISPIPLPKNTTTKNILCYINTNDPTFILTAI